MGHGYQDSTLKLNQNCRSSCILSLTNAPRNLGQTSPADYDEKTVGLKGEGPVVNGALVHGLVTVYLRRRKAFFL